MATTTFVYGDPDHPDRPTSTIASPAYTSDDRALLMALDMYEAGLCRCGFPIEVAWHADMDGEFEGESYVCLACTEQHGQQISHRIVRNIRSATKPPLVSFELGRTTVQPDAAPKPAA